VLEVYSVESNNRQMNYTLNESLIVLKIR